jgi:hypothetical protein
MCVQFYLRTSEKTSVAEVLAIVVLFSALVAMFFLSPGTLRAKEQPEALPLAWGNQIAPSATRASSIMARSVALAYLRRSDKEFVRSEPCSLWLTAAHVSAFSPASVMWDTQTTLIYNSATWQRQQQARPPGEIPVAKHLGSLLRADDLLMLRHLLCTLIDAFHGDQRSNGIPAQNWEKITSIPHGVLK